jgi:membrane fusion protein, heavy metal efflux system
VPMYAPISGTVLKRFVSQGVVVNTSSDLVIVSDLSTLWVNAEVPEKHLAALKLGRRVDVRVQAYSDRVFDGRITFISDSLNPETRTVQVRCETANAEALLKPEMYAAIRFEVGEPRQAMLIPEGSIQDVNGQTVVFVNESATAYRMRQIRPGKRLGEDIEILEGLKGGECVASTGSFILKSELLKKSLSPD